MDAAEIDNPLHYFYITLITGFDERLFQYIGPYIGPRVVSNPIETGEILMRVRHFRCVLMIALYIIVWSFSIADASDSVKWHSYEEGKALGKIEKKKVFLHFYADWCGFCAKMAKETFRNSEVVSYLNENFISIRVDFDKEAETAQKYGVMGLPTNWFLTEMGQPILNIPGYISADAMLAMLKEVNGISAAQ